MCVCVCVCVHRARRGWDLNVKLDPSRLLRDPTAHLPRATRSEVLDAAGRDALGGLFRAMSPDSRARLAEVLRPCAFAPGRVIFAALDVATEFYWVVKGEVEMVDVRGVVLGR